MSAAARFDGSAGPGADDGLGLDADASLFLFDAGTTARALGLVFWPEQATANPAAVEAPAVEILRRWVQAGLPVLDGADGPRFDVGRVMNFMRREGVAGRLTEYQDWTVPAAQRLVSACIALPPQVGPALADPRRYLVRLRREFDLAGVRAGRTLRLRMPAPFADPTQPQVSVRVLEPWAAFASTDTPGRVEVKLPRPAQAQKVTVEAEFDVTAFEIRGPWCEGLEAKLTAEARSLYLRPREGLIRVTPAVRALARSLSGDAPHPREALEAFWDFFLRRLNNGYLRPFELDRDDPLPDVAKRGWFDCFVGSCLLVALCRAQSVPARLVRGAMLHAPAPGFHYWVEAFIDDEGWQAVDIVAWELCGGRPDDLPWSRLFLGRLERRMKFERHPDIFVGAVGIPLPPKWAFMIEPAPGGTRMPMYEAGSGRMIYADTLSVTQAD